LNQQIYKKAIEDMILVEVIFMKKSIKMVNEKWIEDMFIVMMIFMNLIIKMIKEKVMKDLFIYSDGDIYESDFKDDERESHGKYIFLSGRT
jgi:hypothetical protein